MASTSSAAASSKPSNSVMFWTNDHDVILCREVSNVNPYTTKKGSTQRSSKWDKIADTLNKSTVPKFKVDKRSVRDHVGNLVCKHKKKLRAEEKATGITPDEPTELDNLLDTIIALEESAEAELQEMQSTEKREKLQYDRAKAEDVRLKAMEKLSETKKRDCSADEGDENKPKRQRRSGGDAVEYLAERAKINEQLKQEDLKMRKEHQELEREKMELMSKQQLQVQQQQADMLKVMQQQQQQSQQQLLNSQMMMMQQQQQQSKALMMLVEKLTNK